MKNILLASCLALCACGTAKETYTEKRVLTYPKGTTPNLKEMYLREDKTPSAASVVENNTYTGVPESAVTYNDADFLPSNSLEDENERLRLLAVNKILRGMQ
jgi:hypothetical protein